MLALHALEEIFTRITVLLAACSRNFTLPEVLEVGDLLLLYSVRLAVYCDKL